VELLESRTQALADAMYRVLYCQQQHIDISHLIPREGKIALNDVLARLESLKRLPEGVKRETYTDDLLEQFIEDQRSRQHSSLSDITGTLSSNASSRDMNSPVIPPGSMSPTFTLDPFLPQTQTSKMPMYDQIGNLPTSISPSVLMPDYDFSQSDLTMDWTDERLLADPSWY